MRSRTPTYSAPTCSRTCLPASAILWAAAPRPMRKNSPGLATWRFPSSRIARGNSAPTPSLAWILIYEVLGTGNGMLMVSASGTAVVCE